MGGEPEAVVEPERHGLPAALPVRAPGCPGSAVVPTVRSAQCLVWAWIYSSSRCNSDERRPRERSPVIVGVDGSKRATEALALADLIGPALERPVVIAHVHPYGQLSSVFSDAEYDTVVREVAESTFDQVREHLPSVRSGAWS